MHFAFDASDWQIANWPNCGWYTREKMALLVQVKVVFAVVLFWVDTKMTHNNTNNTVCSSLSEGYSTIESYEVDCTLGALGHR